MLVKQSKHSFIRVFHDNIGYITSQLTKSDRVFNETGADFLSCLSRIPQPIEEIVDRLQTLYSGVNKVELMDDYLEFIEQLESNNFVVTGKTAKELEEKDICFKYDSENPKIIGYDFSQGNEREKQLNTQDYFYDIFHSKPQLMDLQIEITSGCNERCIHCYIPNAKKSRNEHLQFEKIIEVIDQFVHMGGLSVTITGGEAFMHKDIDRILRHCREKDLVIGILSNLVLLKDDHIQLLKEINPSIVQVSLYSMDEKIHDQITKVTGSFRKTKISIEKLVSNNIPVQISCPVMKANKNCYKNVLNYAQTIKVKAQTDFVMMAQSDMNTSNLSNRISLKETEELIQDIINEDVDYKASIETNVSKYEDPKTHENLPICGIGMTTICLSANGDYFPCSGWQNYVLGNAYKEKLNDIWSNSERIKYLRTITNASFPQCMICDARNYCSVCLVRNYNENNGDMFKISQHFCEVAHMNKKMVETQILNKQ